MVPYQEQDFYGAALLATILPALGFCLETGYDDSVDLCSSYILIQRSILFY